MKLIENWETKKLTCEQCDSTKFVKWKNYDKVLCQECIVPDVLENNQLSMFPTQEELVKNCLSLKPEWKIVGKL